MGISYEKIRKNPRVFQQLFGLRPEDFVQILEKVSPHWERKVLKTYKRPGRSFKLDLSDMLLMLLLYYRSYISQLLWAIYLI